MKILARQKASLSSSRSIKSTIEHFAITAPKKLELKMANSSEGKAEGKRAELVRLPGMTKLGIESIEDIYELLKVCQ